MEIVKIKVSQLSANTGQLESLPANPRQWTRDELHRLAASLLETPELFEARPCLVYPHEEKYIVLGGNFRLAASRENNTKEVPCIVFPAETPVEKLKEIVIKDNGAFGSWDYDALGNEWDDLPLTEWGVPVWNGEAAAGDGDDMTQDEIARKKREFEQRMAAGEISEEDEEYQAFLEKFALKKTTDDCYTPAKVYDAVADWVAQEYGVSRADFVRPFYPGGDYQKEAYKPTDIVVDNPPFSILAEILTFYKERCVRFFLFAPTLTLFSSSSSSCSCALPLAVPITYDNGAMVSTSFLTNLEDPALRLRSAPSLYAAVKVADDEVRESLRKELPKYAYDHHIITSTWVGALSRLGIDFRVPVAESEPISALAAQKEAGKSIYGKGYIVSDRVFAERERAEREMRERVERWELSDKERAIIARLNSNVKFD